MEGLFKYFLGRPKLHHAAKIHHGHPVRYVTHNAQIVGNKQNRQAELLLQIAEKIDDLCRNRHIQCGYRLIGNDKLRLQCECARNANALLLTARKLTRIAIGVVRRQTAHAHQFFHSGMPSGLVPVQVV